MKHYFFASLLVLLLVNCNQNKEETNKNLDAKGFLNKAIQAHGEALYTGATVTFNLNNYDFKLNRDNYNYRYEMTYTTDTAKHTAATFNGGFEYIVNGQKRSQGSRMDMIVRNRLTDIAYDFYLPYELSGNDAIHTYAGQEIVRLKKYHKVKVSFKQINPEVPDNRLYMLWIDTKTFEVDFIGKQLGGADSRKQFLAAANKRRQNGLLVSDFESYQTKERNKNVPIDSLGIYYDSGRMLLGRSTIFKNIEVVKKK